MGLLDLPPELFGDVIHELVSVVGVLNAREYRRVCKTFAAAIKYETFAMRSITEFGLRQGERYSWQSKSARKFGQRNLSSILFYRCKILLDANAFFPKKLNNLLEHLMEADTSNGSGEVHDNLLQKLCTAVTRNCDAEKAKTVLKALADGPGPGVRVICNAIPTDWECFAARIAMDDINQAFAHFPTTKDGIQHRSLLFGLPLVNVVKAGDARQVKRILKFYAQHAKHRVPAEAIMTGAVASTIDRGNKAMLMAILEFHNKHIVGGIGGKDFRSWLKTGVDQKAGDMVMTLMDFKPSSFISFQLFEEACKLGNPKAISALLAQPGRPSRGLLSAEQEVGFRTPLVVAIESRHVKVVEAVLDAGASANGVHAMHTEPTTIVPLQAALFIANSQIVQLLIDNGAKVKPRLWYRWWPSESRYIIRARCEFTQGERGVTDPVVYALAKQDRELYEILRKAKEEQEGVKLPAY